MAWAPHPSPLSAEAFFQLFFRWGKFDSISFLCGHYRCVHVICPCQGIIDSAISSPLWNFHLCHGVIIKLNLP